MSGYYVKLAETIRIAFGTTGATGAATDADSTPAVSVYEQGTLMGYSPTVTNKATGLYEVAIVLSGANGFEVGKEYSVAVAATVGAVVGRDGIGSFAVVTNSPEDLATAAALTTAQTALSAVKLQTDKFVFSVANQVDSNVLDWKSATAPAMTGDAFARLGAPAGASVSADVAALKVDTAAIKIQTDKFVFSVANQVDSNVIDWKGATAPAMTGDAFARLGAPAGASISADIAAAYARLGAPAGASISADVAAIKTDTTALESRLSALRASYLDNLSVGAVAQASTALSIAQWTNARASYLDNINVGGLVASSTEATAIQNNTRVIRSVPSVIERPDASTTTYRVDLYLYDSVGNMEAPDSAPTVSLVNQAGTSRATRLDSTTLALIATGHYRCIYTADVADTLEQLNWEFTVVEGAVTRTYPNQSLIVDTTAVDFTAADRTKLERIDTDYTTALATKIARIDTDYTTALAAKIARIDTDYTTARAVKIDNLDATVSTRASATALATTDARIDTEIPTVVTAVADIQARLPAALDSGFMKTQIKGIDTDAISAASLATAAVTKIVAGFFANQMEAGPSGAMTFLQRERIMWSIFCAIASGLAIDTDGNEEFMDALNTKPRAAFALATDGSRTPGAFDGD